MAEQPGVVFVNCSASKCAWWEEGVCTADSIDITAEAEGIKCATYNPLEIEEPVEQPTPPPAPTPPRPMRPTPGMVPPPPMGGRAGPGGPVSIPLPPKVR